MSFAERRRASSLAVLTFVALTLATAAPPVQANLRAPVMLDRPPSSALMLLGGEAATLRRVELKARCEGDRCTMTTIYELEAPTAGPRILALLVPEGALGKTVRVAGKETRVASLRFVPRTPKEKELVPAYRPLMGKLVRSAFEAVLPVGTSRLELTYGQELSAEEHGHSYFSKGRFVHRLEHYLFPLKGWALAKDFDLALEVRLARRAPGWWKRTFSKVKTFRCRRGDGKDKPESLLGAQTPVQQGEALVFAARLGRAVPEKLSCTFGDDDQVR